MKHRIIGSFMLQLVETTPNTTAYKLLLFNIRIVTWHFTLLQINTALFSMFGALSNIKKLKHV